MSRLIATLVVLSFVVALPGKVEAGKNAKPKKSAEQRFKKADADGDDKLSVEEFVGKKTDEKKKRAEKRFAKLDGDDDKFLTLDEFKAGEKKSD